MKILVTLGPASMDSVIIPDIASYGVYLFRINMSHTDIDNLESTINLIKNSTDVPICIDSEGSQIRNHKMENGSVAFRKGTAVRIYHDETLGTPERISFSPRHISRKFEIGDRIRVDFDQVCLEVIEKHADYLLAEVIAEGKVGNNKAADLEREIDLPSITQKDHQSIVIGREMGIQNFALSFANSEHDVHEFRNLIGRESNLISKIESRSALKNLKHIVAASDELLIDRGDLSRQIQLEKIPFLQRRIISIARIYSKPIFVATNLLESMLKSPYPTRAELNDIVSTILMGADGLVLAAETAVGRFPAQSVKTIAELLDLCRKWTPNTNIDEILDM